MVTRPNTLEPNSEIEVRWSNPTTAHAAAVKDEAAGDDVVGFFEAIEGGDDILLREPEGLGNGAGGRPAVTRQSLQRQGFDSPPPGNGFPTPGFGDDPFGEVVYALEISPLSDCQFARRPHGRGDLFCDLEVPPSAASTPLHVEGSQWPFVANALSEGFGHLRVLTDDIAPPRVVAEVLAPKPECGVEFERDPACLVTPVLEDRLSRL